MTTENKDVIVVENLEAKEVFAEEGVDNLLKKVAVHYVPKLDPNTEEGREERRSMAYAVAKLKTAVDTMGKDYVGELKKVTTAIDERRRTWRTQMEKLQHDIRKPLTQYEERESKRIGEHNAGINQMRDLMSYDYEPDSKDIEERIAQVKKLAERDYEEFADQAKTVSENSIGRLGEKLAAVIKAEEQERELEELREKQREQDEKNRQAQLQKEADERAAAKVQADLDAANKRAEEAEKRANAPQPETPPPSTPKPEEKNMLKEHKKEVNRAIVNALIDSCLLSESAAKSVVTAIVKGEVPNTTITY